MSCTAQPWGTGVALCNNSSPSPPFSSSTNSSASSVILPRSHEDPNLALRIHLQRWERFASSTELLLGAPERLVGDLDLADETVVAVLSAGPDLFATALSERPGRQGTIYSIELSDELAPNATPHAMPGYVKLRQKEN